jgi:(1->4)-alpha-D-glucan 1-alpha-D-glucosylmutase
MPSPNERPVSAGPVTRGTGRRPISTYRLQLHAGFTFDDARAVVPYLTALGVTDCYISPPYAAKAGSAHGYDVGNHNEINPELGGERACEAFGMALRAAGLGLILDFVPNHMSNDPRTNDWWRDVLENGPSSPYAHFFDIDWDPVKPELKDRLLLPILGEQYGDALERGRLRLAFDAGALVVEYFDLRLPINPRRVPLVFEAGLPALVAELGEDHPDVREFLSILTALRNLPPYIERDMSLIAERQREKEVARDRLARLADASRSIRDFVDRSVLAINGTPGEPASFDRLHELLEQQAYRLASWRTASDEINYRRFFDINELSGLRVEEPDVFDHIHRLILKLIGEGTVTGLRLDHIDGLADPATYLRRLREAAHLARRANGLSGPFYIVVEKILSGGETLRDDWAVEGTTGYNFLNDLNGVFVSQRNARSLERVCVRLTGRNDPLSEVIYESKRLIVGTDMTSESQVLASAVNRLSEAHRRSRDFTFGSIRRVLREVVACFPVYRTYVSADGIAEADRAVVERAIAAAKIRNPAMETSIFEFIRGVLLPERAPAPDWPGDPGDFATRLQVATKIQQFTAPVQAKGIEDTAFYRYNTLLSLNEVGGDPDRFGRSIESFHSTNTDRLARWPLEMTSTATHDTKRGEDARARLNVLSEMPSDWRDAVSRWMRTNRPGRVNAAFGSAPDHNDEYHFYQVLLAIWPAEHEDAPVPVKADAALVQRIAGYMLKAIKEAKVHTSWVNPNTAYEDGVASFVERALVGAGAETFLASFVPFARRTARFGAVNALAQLVLKLTAPGVPDFYQGNELWDLTLVDPDNRQPVDYAVRQRWLHDLGTLASIDDAAGQTADRDRLRQVARLLGDWPDGRIKLLVTTLGLRLRRSRPALFHEGEYLPLRTEGWGTDHVVALARRRDDDVVLAIVPRLAATLVEKQARWPVGAETWRDTRVRLPDGWGERPLRNLVTGELVRPFRTSEAAWVLAGQVFETFPVGLLAAEPTL